MNIIRYHNQGPSDLVQAFDRFAALRDELDRLFDRSLGPVVFRSPGSFSLVGSSSCLAPDRTRRIDHIAGHALAVEILRRHRRHVHRDIARQLAKARIARDEIGFAVDLEARYVAA